MHLKRAGFPGLRVDITVPIIILLLLNTITIAPEVTPPYSSQPAEIPANPGDMSQPGHDMSKMVMPAGGMSTQGKSRAQEQLGLSAVTLNSSIVTVDITNFTFTPVTQTITAGTTVNWNWVSGFHSVVSDTGLFSSLPATSVPGVNFSHTFTQPGKYFYHCSIHGVAGNGSQLGSGMSGVIIVIPAITSLTPDTNMAGNPDFDLTVKGAGFTAASTLKFGTQSEPVTFINSTTLLARVAAGDFATAATVPVIVTEGGEDSGPSSFEVTAGCLDRVITKKTGGTTCGEFRDALANSTDISFALQLGDTIDLGSTNLAWPGQALTINGICTGSGPGLKLDVSSIPGGFKMQAGVTINGLQIFSSGINPFPVLSIIGSSGPNKFSCIKIAKV